MPGYGVIIHISSKLTPNAVKKYFLREEMLPDEEMLQDDAEE